MRKRVNSNRAASQPSQLLFDIEAAGEILSLPVDVVDRLCWLGLLTPSIVIGNSRLFSELDLRKFAHPDAPRQINLNHCNEELLTA